DPGIGERAHRLQQRRAGDRGRQLDRRPGLQRHGGPPPRRRAPAALHRRAQEGLSPARVRRLITMGILDFLKRRPEPTASVARERLRIIVAQERSSRGAPDYLPMMRNELLEVIKKYVHVDIEAININLERDSGHEILELSVTLPDGKAKSDTTDATTA